MMSFRQILKNLWVSIKKDILGLLKRKYVFNPDVFIDPDKYARPLSIVKIVADSKVSRDGVEFYKKKIANNEKINPIIVVKHPRIDLYAVLDGHHRYWACREMGKKTIDSALAGDYSSVNFYLTEYGFFQPSSETTEKLREPAKKMHENLKQFLDEFIKEGNMRREIKKRKEEK
jgi:uncharacterized ParB-like nuclease family protein